MRTDNLYFLQRKYKICNALNNRKWHSFEKSLRLEISVSDFASGLKLRELVIYTSGIVSDNICHRRKVHSRYIHLYCTTIPYADILLGSRVDTFNFGSVLSRYGAFVQRVPVALELCHADILSGKYRAGAIFTNTETKPAVFLYESFQAISV